LPSSAQSAGNRKKHARLKTNKKIGLTNTCHLPLFAIKFILLLKVWSMLGFSDMRIKRFKKYLAASHCCLSLRPEIEKTEVLYIEAANERSRE
jgi:hypothetical protein